MPEGKVLALVRDPVSDAAARLCAADNWSSVLDDPAPRAVRWATRLRVGLFNEPDWTRWHYTEGNGCFTACGAPVVPFLVDGSPQEGELRKVNCRRCRAKLERILPNESSSSTSEVCQ